MSNPSDELESLKRRCAELEQALRSHQQEASQLRRAFLHERYRANLAGAPHAYSGPVLEEALAGARRDHAEAIAFPLAKHIGAVLTRATTDEAGGMPPEWRGISTIHRRWVMKRWRAVIRKVLCDASLDPDAIPATSPERP